MTEQTERPVLKAIAGIMAEVGAVEKRGKNTFHNYEYATAADIAFALQKKMAAAGLIIVPHQRNMSLLGDGAVLAMEFEFMVEHISGDKLDERPCFTGMASARNSKGSFDDKAANKCLTAATKYFALNLFRIPTGDYHDADAAEDAPARKNGNGHAPEPDPDKYVEGALAVIAEEPSLEFCLVWWKDQAENRRKNGLTQGHVDVLKRAIAERFPEATQSKEAA